MVTSLQITCAEPSCGKKFTYEKHWNAVRKFCEECATARIQASKKRSLIRQKQPQKNGRKTVAEKLALIQDHILSPTQLLDRIARDLR
jgi:hypothetical protein